MSDQEKIFVQETAKNQLAKIKIEQKTQSINNLVANTDYIEWLNEFTILNDGDFFQKSWKIDVDQLPSQEKEKVKNLGNFYNKIFEYANKKGIEPYDNNLFRFFKIKYLSNMFHIGFMKKNSEYFCCMQYQDDEKKYIDIEDVIKDKTLAKIKDNNEKHNI